MPVGRDYSFKYTENWAVRIIFENDDADDAIFQIEYTTEEGVILGAMSLMQLSSLVTLVGCASTMLLLS